ncbi:hypothetical protein C8R44DRAFT_882743 [Mycena epipterygia]|nr:hypothetical protein C8R44DRAFT_882743 [Mycena epipterygia]
MDDDNNDVLRRLERLFNEFHAARGRVSELQLELEHPRTTIARLESDNGATQKEVAALRGAVKVKKERIEVDSNAARTTIAQHDLNKRALQHNVKWLRRTIDVKEDYAVKSVYDEKDKSERDAVLAEALFSQKCFGLECEAQASVDAACEAQACVERTLGKMRLAHEDQRNQTDDLQRVHCLVALRVPADLEKTALSTRITDQAVITLNIFQQDNEILNTTCRTLTAKINIESLEAESHDLRAERARLHHAMSKAMEVTDLLCVSNSFHSAVRSGNRCEQLTAERDACIEALHARYVRELSLNRVLEVYGLEDSLAALRAEAVASAEPSLQKLALYRDHVKTFLVLARHPGMDQLISVCRFTEDFTADSITEHMDPNILSSPVLYLNFGTIATHNAHFIACAPTHSYDFPSQKWVGGSRLTANSAASASPGIMDRLTLFPSGCPKNKKSRRQLLEAFWGADGIQATCLGFRVHRFYARLYDALLDRFPKAGTGCKVVKRVTDNQGSGSAKKKPHQ